MERNLLVGNGINIQFGGFDVNVYASDDMSLMLAPIALYNFFGSRSSNKCDMLPFCEVQHMKNNDLISQHQVSLEAYYEL